ncbi:Methanol oxidation protein [Rhodovulum sp. P5]|uniref:DUF4336 domain-containing protein n=1 Tax=Rhodovulum sp. P5 TaxID=1564506 RepID=UPI0009C30A62|nr:DUF4336 domain-containing protein [Rhodovulum sp. P5]ARE42130.1 Methanol oxidation protein [Rhodovulum sp. P5]
MGGARQVYAPLNTLKALSQTLWIADGPLIPFYGMPFPTRMTVVRLTHGEVWLHSPTAPDERLIAEVQALGHVRFLIAPNALHYAYLPAWAARFPNAQVYAAPGVARRAARHDVDFPVHTLLDDHVPEGWAGTLRQKLIPGHFFLKEVVFFHDPSRTLILTDLIENFDTARIGPLMRLGTWIAGTQAPHGQTPRDAQLTWSDKAAAAHALREVIAWKPERVVLAHGDLIEDDVEARLRHAFSWAL